MGLVFASRRTWIDPDQLDLILGDDEYRRLGVDEEPVPGDLVVYRRGGVIEHIGLVIENPPLLTAATKRLIILSQWGADGEYFHDVNDVNPQLGKPAEYWTDRQ